VPYRDGDSFISMEELVPVVFPDGTAEQHRLILSVIEAENTHHLIGMDYRMSREDVRRLFGERPRDPHWLR
jgi:hypothetical protein